MADEVDGDGPRGLPRVHLRCGGELADEVSPGVDVVEGGDAGGAERVAVHHPVDRRLGRRLVPLDGEDHRDVVAQVAALELLEHVEGANCQADEVAPAGAVARLDVELGIFSLDRLHVGAEVERDPVVADDPYGGQDGGCGFQGTSLSAKNCWPEGTPKLADCQVIWVTT